MRTRYFSAWLLLALAPNAFLVQAKAQEATEEATPARISPVQGSAAAPLSDLESPLLLSPVEAAKLKTQIQNYLTQKAGVAIRLTGVPKGDRDIRWVYPQYEDAKNARQRYWLVGQHLLMADSLIQSRYPDDQMTGLDIARIAGQNAASVLKDSRLSAQIAQAYLLPHYMWAEEDTALSRVSIARYLVEAFQAMQDDPKLSPGEKYGEEENLIAAQRLFISVTNDEAKADYMRWNIAKALERRFRYEEAIRYLQEVNPLGSQHSARKEIPRLRSLLETQRQDAAALAARLSGDKAKENATPDAATNEPQITKQDK